MSIYEQTIKLLKEPVIEAYYGYKNGSFQVFEKESQAKHYSNLTEKFSLNHQDLESSEKFLLTFKNLLFKRYPTPFFDLVFDTSMLLSENDLSEVEFAFDVLISFCDKITKKQNLPDVRFQESESFVLGMYYSHGYYAGSLNGNHCFVSENIKRIPCVDYNQKNLLLPSTEELLMMYNNKEEFNKNCPTDQKWVCGWYWGKDFSGRVGFTYGTVTGNDKFFSGNFRTICRIPEI
jgi:hypothetical protein